MSAPDFREYRLRVSCVTATSLAVSSGDEGAVSDSALRRRADGTLVVPGTSIAGTLRSVVERMAGVDRTATAKKPCLFVSEGGAHGNKDRCECDVCAVFGNVRPGTTGAHASRIRVLDAEVKDGAVRVADGVAIDRRRRSAAEMRKYDFEEVRPGASIAIEVRTEPTAALVDQELAWIVAALELLAAEQIPLGGRTAAGQGVLKVASGERVRIQWRDPSKADHLIAALMNDSSSDAAWPGNEQEVRTAALNDLVAAARSALHEEHLTLTLSVAKDSSFLIGDPVEALRTGYDAAPLGGVSGAEMTGRAPRGALRSGAERILRTINIDGACDPFNRESSCAAKYKRADDESRKHFVWCTACTAFGNEEWASRVRIHVRRDEESQPYAMPFDHVAIDRFTGGAMDGRKFDRLTVRNATYTATLSLNHVSLEDRPWMRALLAFVVQDLIDGRITVGRGSAVGHGWFDVTVLPQSTLRPSEEDVDALWAKLGVTRPSAAEIGA